MEKIEKPTIIITSLGRTGTKFFAKVFDLALPHSTALHQPDIISRSKNIIEQFKDSGFLNLTLYRTVGKWSLIQLSDKVVQGALTSQQAAQELYRQRHSFISNKKGNVYIESSSGYYGLVHVLGDVFQNYKGVYFIRDGRDWVVSQYNWGGLYSEDLILGKLKHLFGHRWLTAKNFQDDSYAPVWDEMSRFKKICWAWARLNQQAINKLSQDVHTRLFKFEDIFRNKRSPKKLFELLEFTTDLPNVGKVDWERLEGILDRPENQSYGNFPAWKQWTEDQRNTFNGICGPLMNEMGYF